MIENLAGFAWSSTGTFLFQSVETILDWKMILQETVVTF
jgi:hypothetical protein